MRARSVAFFAMGEEGHFLTNSERLRARLDEAREWKRQVIADRGSVIRRITDLML